MRKQQFRGNPETKLVVTRDNFAGGVNITASDDGIGKNDVRYLQNYHLDDRGDLSPRKSFLPVGALHDLFIKAQYQFPTVYQQGSNMLVNTTLNNSNEVEIDTQILSGLVGSNREVETYYLVDFQTRDPLDMKTSLKMPEFNFEVIVRTTDNGVSVDQTVFQYSGDNTAKGGLGIVAISGYNNRTKSVYAIALDDLIDISPSLSAQYKPSKLILKVTSMAFDDGTNEIKKICFTKRKAPKTDTPTKLPNINYISNFEHVSVTRNDNNILERLAEYASFDDFIRYNKREKSVLEFAVSYAKPKAIGGTSLITLIDKLTISTIRFNIDDDKVNVSVQEIKSPVITDKGDYAVLDGKNNWEVQSSQNTVIRTKELFFTGVGMMFPNDAKMVEAGIVSHNLETGLIKHYGCTNAKYNNAYKPTPLEIRKIGFNVLGTSPLNWVENSTITGDSIQGVFLTLDGALISKIPLTQNFLLNVMYTGKAAEKLVIKFFHGTGDDKKEISAKVTKVSDKSSLYTAQVEFTTPPTDEVEIELNTGIETLSKHYEYYRSGDVGDNLKPVKSIDASNHTIWLVWDRLVLTKDDTIWYSHHTRFDYFPNNNYITLPISPSDEIQAMVYFRQNYIIFTKEKIFKLSGNFLVDEMKVELVSDEMGCIAPASVKVVNNQIIFLSSHGLHALTSAKFVANMENLEKLDNVLGDLSKTSYNAFAMIADDQYILYNGNSVFQADRNLVEYIDLPNGKSYKRPDVIRYYLDTGDFTFDNFDAGAQPRFVFEKSGKVFAFSESGIHLYRTPYPEEETTDFGVPFTLVVETAAENVDFPNHEKKFKQMVIKLGKQSYQQVFKLVVYADGYEVYEKIIQPDELIEIAEVEGSRFMILKLRLPSIKCKNIAFELTTDTKLQTSLIAVSYVYKLGKMRE